MSAQLTCPKPGSVGAKDREASGGDVYGGLAGLTRGALSTAHGMLMAHGTTTGVTWAVMATLATMLQEHREALQPSGFPVRDLGPGPFLTTCLGFQ